MAEYKIGKGTILRILDSAGLTRKHQQMNEAQINEAIKLYEDGWSLMRLGQYLGFDHETVRSALKRRDVAIRRPWDHLL